MPGRRSVRMIPVAELDANPDNVRRDLPDVSELAVSVRALGVLEPLLVTEAGDRWLVLAGHRRLAAARRVRLGQVPCVVLHQLTEAVDQVVLGLTENMQRTQLTPVDKAKAFGRLRNMGLTQGEICRRTGVGASTVSTHLALLDADGETLRLLDDGVVSAGDVIDAVRAQRKRDRDARRRGRQPGRRAHVEPDWFTAAHPLAEAVRAACTHTDRPGLPRESAKRVGCGQCWEHAIRADAVACTSDAPMALASV